MSEPPPIAPQRARLLVVGAVLLAAVGGLVYYIWPSTTAQLAQARFLQLKGQFDEAQTLATMVYRQDPKKTEAALIAAQCALARNLPEEAVAILETVPDGESEWHLRCEELLAQTCHESLARLLQAETAYRSVLEVEPDHQIANEGLARLLGQTARRREAIEPVLRLIRSGVETDHLMLIARERGVISDPPLLERATKAEPHAASALLGLAWHAAEARHTSEARSLLEQAVTRDPSLAAAWGALGQRLYLEGDFSGLLAWERRLPASIQDAEVWLGRAGLSESLGDDRSAIRCYGEAVQLAPESRRAVSNLSRLLARQGASEESRKMEVHLAHLDALEVVQNRCFSSGQAPNLDDLLDLIRCFENAGRLWEMIAWSAIASDLDPKDPRVSSLLSRLPNPANLVLELTDPLRNPARTIDWTIYPLPIRTTGELPMPPVVATNQSEGPPSSFEEQAQQVGLQFQFDDGTRGEPRLRMQQITGGGIGVVDYDGDHAPDVLCSQGGGPWMEPDSDRGDRLFRNVSGQRFIEVTALAGIREDDFGQGVAVGDINGDGFPDLYVAGIGMNRLWLNNGDGSFSDASADSGLVDDRWTTSCLVADLNGDGHPDLYDVNYLAGEKLFEQVCHAPDGSPTMCMPFDFDGAADRIWLSDGAGHFRDATAEMLDIVPNGKGLGIAAWSADGTGRLSLLIANDTTPNFYFTPSIDARGQRLREQAVSTGLALSESGKAQGCMGIAVADVDGDGQIEACLTNFLAEANVFYRGVGSGFYEDQTRRVGLFETTLDSLGFGTQFLDANLDGELELAFANGHIQNLEKTGRPYRMSPKLFTWRADHFQPVEAKTIGPYFERAWLARAMARLDWNSDGREDLAISHLDDPLALLTNTTATTTKSLTLQLIATGSAREAIGATVHLQIGNRTWVKPITAGDGYQVSNDRRLVWGAGKTERIDRLTIHWPSGRIEEFGPVELPCAGIAREGAGTLLLGP